MYSTVLICFGNKFLFVENKNSFEHVSAIHVILNDDKNCDDNMNDRCKTLNMILASLLKHCFSGHAHFCTVSYYMNKFDGLNFCGQRNIPQIIQHIFKEQ